MPKLPRVFGRAALRTLMVGCVALAAAAPASAGVPAPAPSGADNFRCRMAVSDLGVRLDVRYRLRSDVAGRDWRVRLWDNDVLFFSKVRTTNADGRFTIVNLTDDQRGRDAIVGKGRNLVTDQVCRVEVEI